MITLTTLSPHPPLPFPRPYNSPPSPYSQTHTQDYSLHITHQTHPLHSFSLSTNFLLLSSPSHLRSSILHSFFLSLILSLTLSILIVITLENYSDLLSPQILYHLFPSFSGILLPLSLLLSSSYPFVSVLFPITFPIPFHRPPSSSSFLLLIPLLTLLFSLIFSLFLRRIIVAERVSCLPIDSDLPHRDHHSDNEQRCDDCHWMQQEVSTASSLTISFLFSSILSYFSPLSSSSPPPPLPITPLSSSSSCWHLVGSFRVSSLPSSLYITESVNYFHSQHRLMVKVILFDRDDSTANKKKEDKFGYNYVWIEMFPKMGEKMRYMMMRYIWNFVKKEMGNANGGK